ncbi:MAG: glycerate kinase [Actinomycetota bacterium]|nr:glycerate kinase [Actinomycetota bacterium]
MRLLVAPDKFRGTATASEVAGAIAEGWRRARSGDEVDQVPLADGGEGTLDALVDALDGRRIAATVTGPVGDPVRAEFGLVDAALGRTAVVEMARASGLQLVPPGRRDPKVTTTFGTGQLILAACAQTPPPASLIVCIGGSATNDGGAGMAQALGVRLLDADGRDLGPGGAALAALDRIDAHGLAGAVRGVRFVVASDVDNPLVGPEGASAVYGPQKGATPEDVAALDAALAHFAEVIRRDLGVDVRDRPGAGAAGGLGAGLMAFLGAEMRPGVDVVMEAVGFADRLARADLVITGEGKLDRQSLRGKVPAGVLSAARRAGKPVAVVCGQAEIRLEGVPVVSLVEAVGAARAFGDTRSALREVAESMARSAEGPIGEAS